MMDRRAADLLLAYDWPYDEPFLGRLDQTLRACGRSLVSVDPQSLGDAFERLERGDLTARAFLDRAADTDPAFERLEAWAETHVPLLLNPASDRRRIWKKSNVHWEFIRAGLHAPHTLFVPALNRQPVLDPLPDFTRLGASFAIKPDLGGGGWGVTLGARSWARVEQVRREMPDDDLLLQELVEPEVVDGRRAWFRVFFACGAIVPCWWDDRTRLFGDVIGEEGRRRWGLDRLWEVAEIAAGIARLQLFSTEVARLADGRWVVVDYVNDPIDLRLLPHAREGMPVEAAQRIAEAIAGFIAAHSG
jgi:hypothetical protein